MSRDKRAVSRYFYLPQWLAPLQAGEFLRKLLAHLFCLLLFPENRQINNEIHPPGENEALLSMLLK